ncbi:hypothetical protein ACFL43_01850 [Thermodesulfobacteriota bacterium]
MADLDKLVSKFVREEITLFSKDISASAKSREWFLTRLQNIINSKLENGETIPQLYSRSPFVYFGSYFKGTKVRDVDEYDVLVVLDSNNGQFKQSGNIIGKGVGSCVPCNKYLKKYFKSPDDSGVSPTKLLNWLKEIVKEIVESFGGEAPERAGQSITAIIKSQNLKIDLVPAGIFTHTNDSSKIFYDIPKGDKNSGWILTAPHEDIKIINDVAGTRPEFKNVLRVLKSVRSDYTFDVSSFAVECSAVSYALSNTWTDSIAKNLHEALLHFADRLRKKSIIDTWDDASNLIEHLDVNEWYAERVEGICQLMYDLQEEYDESKAYDKLKRCLRNE